MKFQICIACILCTLLVGIAAADAQTAAAQITVTGVSISPDMLMRGDTGTVAVTIANNGDESVAISRAKLYTGDLTVVNDLAYESVGTIGAGNTMQFTFTVKADVPDGIYYLSFYLDFRDAGSLRYSIPVTVESTEASVSILEAPESYTAGNKESITVTVGNPRDNTIKGVIATIEGPGIESTKNSAFIGDLAPGASAAVSFDVTTLAESEMTVTVAYRNGINDHTTTLAIPVTFGDDKLGAELVLNSIEFSGSSSYTLSGDITNAGLSDAKSIVVTVQSPAVATDPNGIYVIGALEPDDFSSFDLTFTTAGSSVPLLITYKDEDGNTFSETFTVSLRSTGTAASSGTDAAVSMPSGAPAGGPGRGVFGGFGSGLGQLPLMEIALVLLAGIVAVIGWRKGWITKAKAKISSIRAGKRD